MANPFVGLGPTCGGLRYAPRVEPSEVPYTLVVLATRTLEVDSYSYRPEGGLHSLQSAAAAGGSQAAGRYSTQTARRTRNPNSSTTPLASSPSEPRALEFPPAWRSRGASRHRPPSRLWRQRPAPLAYPRRSPPSRVCRFSPVGGAGGARSWSARPPTRRRLPSGRPSISPS